MAININCLPAHMLRDLGSEGAEYSDKEIESWSAEECLEKWLEWNGILGYAGTIISAVKAIEHASKVSVQQW
jgi:hypothetical protein